MINEQQRITDKIIHEITINPNKLIMVPISGYPDIYIKAIFDIKDDITDMEISLCWLKDGKENCIGYVSSIFSGSPYWRIENAVNTMWLHLMDLSQ